MIPFPLLTLVEVLHRTKRSEQSEAWFFSRFTGTIFLLPMALQAAAFGGLLRSEASNTASIHEIIFQGALMPYAPSKPFSLLVGAIVFLLVALIWRKSSFPEGAIFSVPEIVRNAASAVFILMLVVSAYLTYRVPFATWAIFALGNAPIAAAMLRRCKVE